MCPQRSRRGRKEGGHWLVSQERRVVLKRGEMEHNTKYWNGMDRNRMKCGDNRGRDWDVVWYYQIWYDIMWYHEMCWHAVLVWWEEGRHDLLTSRLVSPAPYRPLSVSMGMNRFQRPAPLASATRQCSTVHKGSKETVRVKIMKQEKGSAVESSNTISLSTYGSIYLPVYLCVCL